METTRLRGRSSKLPALHISDGTIELQKVSIRGVLRSISGTISGGSRLAITGDNGAGKSTLLQVIARLVDPDRGKVLIDGQDIRRCNLTSVREAIGIVSPDLPLLKGTVRYNLKEVDATVRRLRREADGPPRPVEFLGEGSAEHDAPRALVACVLAPQVHAVQGA